MAKGQRLITLFLINGKGLKRALAKQLEETKFIKGQFSKN